MSSAGTLQELVHAYLPVGREATLDAALTLAQGRLAQLASEALLFVGNDFHQTDIEVG